MHQPSAPLGPVSSFIDRHFQHFNAATLRDAAQGYRALLDRGGGMFLAMAGAMSTAELGISLAAMIRAGAINAISCTGANLEEDLFNLVAHSQYRRIPDYRTLSQADEAALLAARLNRVTDTCIPEEAAIKKVERAVLEEWQKADAAGTPRFPHEFLYAVIRSGVLAGAYEIDTADSWLIAAAERNLPIFVPGWEDSSLGNIFAAHCLKGNLKHVHTVRSGVEAMLALVEWYRTVARERPFGFFQIGGGISGDFPICVVPLLSQDLGEPDMPRWQYFCQISDSTTSYGSYSGAVPNEKITWGKLDPGTPSFIIESDATIVAPLVFARVLNL
ncbi:MAG: deoxyhypusine synthase family protein [Vicinamibacterales bacterium]